MLETAIIGVGSAASRWREICIAAAWQEFALSANRLLLAKAAGARPRSIASLPS